MPERAAAQDDRAVLAIVLLIAEYVGQAGCLRKKPHGTIRRCWPSFC